MTRPPASLHWKVAASNEHLRRRHEQRLNGHQEPPDLTDPELAAAWHSLQLHWLRTVPGYKEAVRQKVSEAARKAEAYSNRIDRHYQDVDYLGREVDGCG